MGVVSCKLLDLIVTLKDCIHLVNIHKMVDRTWGGVIFNALIVTGFLVLVMTIMHGKNINKILSEEMQQANVDFQVYKDKSETCFKELQTRGNEVNERDGTINQLNEQINTLRDEKANLEVAVTDVTNQLNEANANIANLLDEKAAIEEALRVKTEEAAAAEAKANEEAKSNEEAEARAKAEAEAAENEEAKEEKEEA